MLVSVKNKLAVLKIDNLAHPKLQLLTFFLVVCIIICHLYNILDHYGPVAEIVSPQP